MQSIRSLLNRSNLYLLFLVTSALLLSSTSVYPEKGNGLEALITSPYLVETMPGNIITTTVVVKNNIKTQIKAVEEVTVPEGWQVVVPYGMPFSLKTGEEQVRFVTLRIPASTEAGAYDISYRVKSQSDNDIGDQKSFTVKVLPLIKLDAFIDDIPGERIAGDAYEIKLRVVNRGNSGTGVRIEISPYPSFKMKYEPHTFTLAPGASQTVTISVETDNTIDQIVMHTMRIKAVAEAVKGGEVFIEKNTAVKVIPRITGFYDPYNRFPVLFRFVGLGDKGNKGLQGELSGGGPLDEEGKKNLDFLFRSPDTQNISSYGEQDEYRMNYSDEKYSVLLGDQTYSLSSLTEDFKYGRGMMATYSPSRFSTGVYMLTTRWAQPGESERGGFVRYCLNDSLFIQGNALGKNRGTISGGGGGLPASWNQASLLSLMAQYNPSNALNLMVESASCASNSRGASTDNAYRIKAYGDLKNDISYSIDKVYAGPRYFGYYSDGDYMNGTLYFPIIRNLKGSLSYRSYRDNLSYDPARRTSNLEKSMIVGTTYSLPSGLNLSLEYEDFSRDDLFVPVDYTFRTKRLRWGIGKSFNKFGIQTFIEQGNLHDLLYRRGENLGRTSVYAYYNPSPSQNFSFYTINGDNTFYLNPQRTNTVGVSTSLQFSRRMSLNLNYDRYSAREDPNRQSFFSTLSYNFPNESSLSIVSRIQTGRIMDRDSVLLVTYNLPFGIPVSKKTDVSVLKGKVYDSEKEGNPPLGNVVVLASGATAVTDRNGKFIFPALTPGEYYVSVYRNSIGIKRTTVEKTPLSIDMKGGTTKEISLGIITSAKLSGRVVIYGLPQQTGAPALIRPGQEKEPSESLVEKQGLSNVLVEITRGDEVIRQMTDSQGRFSFADIRPGKWLLKVDNDALPELHYIEENDVEIELAPGSEKELSLRVLPKKRTIKIIDEGEIRKK